MRCKHRRRGFALVEVLLALVLVAVLGVLIQGIGWSLLTEAKAERTMEVQTVLDGALGEAADLCTTSSSGTLDKTVFGSPLTVSYTCTGLAPHLWRVRVSATYWSTTITKEGVFYR